MGFLCATMAVFGLIFSITAQEVSSRESSQ